MSKKRPIVCVISEVPKLADTLRKGCAAICSKITDVDPKSIGPSDQSLLAEAEIIVSEPHQAHLWLNDLPNLKLVHGTWAGVDSMMRVVKEEGYTPQFTYCRFGGRFGQAMSEYVIAYIIAQERNFRMSYDAQKEANWSVDVREFAHKETRNLDTLSIGILGLGDIGSKVAELCKGAGMKVWGMVNSMPKDDTASSFVDEYRTSDDLDTILSNCDYICNILPSIPQTKGLLDGSRLKMCYPKKSTFINVGRGDICSEKSVLNALDNEWISATILDVFVVEPLSSTSPLWKHPNVTITPHVSAVSLPEELSVLISENIERYVHDRPLKYVVDWTKGY